MKRDQNVIWQRRPMAGRVFSGQAAIIVGGTGGIGRGIARVLASRGTAVTVVGQTFRDAGQPGISFVEADLSSLRTAREVASALPAETADLLIFTAGIIAAPKRQLTAEGIERDMAVSYLNRYVMLRDLAPRLGTARSQPTIKPRVFVMAYPGAGQAGDPADMNADRHYKAFPQHMNTVAANEALVRAAAQKFGGLNVFGLNPGWLKTNIRSNLFDPGSLKSVMLETLIGWFGPTPEAYAIRVAPLFRAPELEPFSGALFDRKARAIQSSPRLTEHRVEAFWAASEALVKTTGLSFTEANNI